MRIRNSHRFLLVSLLVSSPEPTLAQVTARQGVAAPPEIVNFASPMVLELPLPNVGPLKPGTQMQLPNVRKYICDNNVSLLSLTISKKQTGPKKARLQELVFSGLVSVADSYDRRVDIILRLKSGNNTVALQRLRNLKTEEERNTPFRVVLPVSEPSLSAALAADEPPTLELTLVVRDDS